MNPPKPVEFLGSSLRDLKDFPVSARQEAGYQIDRVQNGLVPTYWRPMPFTCFTAFRRKRKKPAILISRLPSSVTGT